MSSQKNEKFDHFPDGTKLIGDEKYESTDSGFLSGGNLTVSGEILSEEVIKEEQDQEEPTQEEAVQKKVVDPVGQPSYMRLDSGVDLGLSESFSGLNLKSPGLNDLSRTQEFGKSSTATASSTSVVITPEDSNQLKDDQTWKDCFQQDENGDTLLHVAIEQGFIEATLTLIRLAPHPFLLDTPNDDAQTPIHLAVSTHQPKIVRWLIVAGAKPSPRNKHGDSPLHIACRNGDLECCKAITAPIQEQERQLLALRYPQQMYHQLNLDQWNFEGQTCLHVAAIHNNIHVLRHLVWCGADVNAREGRTGYTILHFAIERGNELLLQFLLAECKHLNFTAVTYGGCSALQLGCRMPQAVYDFLRAKGAASPYSSDEEESDSESEPEMNYENTSFPPLVNASA